MTGFLDLSSHVEYQPGCPLRGHGLPVRSDISRCSGADTVMLVDILCFPLLALVPILDHVSWEEVGTSWLLPALLILILWKRTHGVWLVSQAVQG